MGEEERRSWGEETEINKGEGGGEGSRRESDNSEGVEVSPISRKNQTNSQYQKVEDRQKRRSGQRQY
jgi:hypothetical protein